MTHRKGAVWTERGLLVMILVCLAGTFHLVLTIHRRTASRSSARVVQIPQSPAIPPKSQAPESDQSPPKAAISQESPAVPEPPRAPVLPTPAEDPTEKILARMATAQGREIESAEAADRRTAQLETARRAAAAESQRWKRRELLVRQQVAALTRQAEGLEREVSTWEAERDVLERERDLLKAALSQAGRRSGYSVLPYKGANGTWRRPIVLECSGSIARLQPRGPAFSMLDLSPLIHPRASPVVLAIAREMLHIQRAETPDGAPAVPYLVFLVRPDGIRPYYEARARLEPLGIAFGYELIEQDLAVEIPDFDDLSTWDGTTPLDPPASLALAAQPGTGRPRTAETERGGQSLSSGAGSGSAGVAAAPSAWPPAQDGWSGQPGPRRSDLARGFPAGAVPDARPRIARPGQEEDAPRGGWGAGPGRDHPPGAGQGDSDSSPEDFVWPSTSRAGRPGGGAGAQSHPDPWGTADVPGARGEEKTSSSSTGTHPRSVPGIGPGGETGRPGGAPGAGGPWSPMGPGAAVIGRRSTASEPSGGPAATGRAEQGSESTRPRGGQPDGTDPLSASGADLSARADEPPVQTNGAGLVRPDASGSNLLPDLEPARDRDRPPLPGGPAAGSSSSAESPGGSPRLGASPPSVGGSSPRSSSPAPADPDTRNPGSVIGSGADSLSTLGANPRPAPGGSERGSSSPGPMGPSIASNPAGINSSLLEHPSGSSSRASGNPTARSGLGLPSLGMEPNPDSEPDSLKEFAVPSIATPDRPPASIEVPFEIVMVCRADDLLLHPGGYRITAEALRNGGGSGSNRESLLKRELRAMVRRRAQVDPLIRPRPSIKFLVETNGATTFWTARRQLLFSGLDWPMSLQVAGPQARHVLHEEAGR